MPTPSQSPWRTISGGATAKELEQACAERGVRFDRARRTYWQRERLFPLSAARVAGRRPSQGGFHPQAVDLALLVDAYLDAELPYRPAGARSSLVPLRELLAQWWSLEIEADPGPRAAEGRFYSHVGEAARACGPGMTGSTSREADDPRLEAFALATGSRKPHHSPRRGPGAISVFEPMNGLQTALNR